MNQEAYFLVNDDVKKSVINRIIDIKASDKIKVSLSGSGTKTQRQQALDWKWDGEIFSSGKGWGEDTVQEVHARGKWIFARPILLSNPDNDIFIMVCEHFTSHYGNNDKKILEFSHLHISTQNMSKSDVVDYMTHKQNYWTSQGVNLTDPSLYGLNYDR